jgi:hypothetical protein
LKVYLEETNKKPKIYVTPIISGFFEETIKVEIDDRDDENIEGDMESMKKVEIKKEVKS